MVTFTYTMYTCTSYILRLNLVEVWRSYCTTSPLEYRFESDFRSSVSNQFSSIILNDNVNVNVIGHSYRICVQNVSTMYMHEWISKISMTLNFMVCGGRTIFFFSLLTNFHYYNALHMHLHIHKTIIHYPVTPTIHTIPSQKVNQFRQNDSYVFCIYKVCNL